MVKAAAERGWIDGTAVALEHLTAIKRAGADFVLTYFAARGRRGCVARDWLTSPDECAGSRGPGGRSPAASTRRCGRSRRSAGAVLRGVRATAPYVVRRRGHDVPRLRAVAAAPSLLGHAHPGVVDAVAPAAGEGTTFGAPTPRRGRLAEAICERVPGCEQVRLVSSGTEAAMTAVRLARGATGRRRIVKFAGCYHGHADALLAGGGSGVATLGLPGSAGVPAGAVADTIVAAVQRRARRSTRSVACVIVEPVAANMGLVAAGRPGSSSGLRGGLRRGRRAARLRRGHHRLPPRPRRRDRVRRRHAGPVVLRQGDRRRAAARRVRRPGRAARPRSRRSARSTRPARCRGTRSPPRPGSPCSRTSSRPTTTT